MLTGRNLTIQTRDYPGRHGSLKSERIAYGIVKRLGRSPLRVGYSIVLADLVMAPITPSNTARAGGILFPITLNVARAFWPDVPHEDTRAT